MLNIQYMQFNVAEGESVNEGVSDSPKYNNNTKQKSKSTGTIKWECYTFKLCLLSVRGQ